MRLRDVATVERLPMPASQPPSSSAAPSSAVRDMPQLNIHYVPSRLPAGIVVGLWGDAVMRQDDGGARTLQLGDVVTKGDVLLTAQNGVVEISLGGTAVATNARPAKGDGLDQLIASLDNGEIDIAPGAGLGGSEGSLQPGVVVDRIIEVVTPQEYQFAYEQPGTLGEIENTEISAASATDEPDSETGMPADDPVASSTVFVALVGPASGSITEGETAKFTVSLSQPAATDVTVQLTYSGTATDGSDYTAVTSVTIPAGQSSVDFDLSTIDDALAEGSESITVSVGEITGGGFEAIAADPAKGSVTTLVTDDVGGPGGGTPGSEDTCLVSIAGPASVVEGQTATGYTVSLSQPAATDVTVKLTYSGTATDGSDYTAVTSVTIPAGQSSVDFDLSTIDDALAEGSETITISVGEITGGGFEAIAADPDKGSVTTLVTDDVGGPGGGTPGAEDTCLVSIAGPASVVEGQTATGYTVSLSQPAATDVTIKLTYSGTATDGSDYTAVTSVTIPAGQSSVEFDLSTIDDALAEGSETITISVGEITGGGFEAIAADPAKGSVTTLVTDDVGGKDGSTPGSEDTCLVSIAGPASVVEGQTATGYTVSLSQPAATDVTVKLTYSGTATDGSDYTAVTSLTIPAGQSSVDFDLSTIDDALAEGSESITVSVGEITGGGFEAIAADPAKGSVTTLVTDDVGGPGGGTPGAEDTCLVSITGPASGSVTEGETAKFTVSLSQPAATDVTIKLTYSGTATDGSDYTAVTSVTIPAGQTSTTFDLSTIDDALAEGSETITVSVGEITGGGFEAIAADPAKGSVTTLVTDDVGGPGGGTPGGEDTCLVSITGPASGSVTEGETARFTVSLSQPASTDVTVKLTYSGTATDGSDYTAVTSVTIPAGQSSVSFDLSTIDDALAEGSETITISVGEITGGGFEAIAADPTKGSVTTLVTDDVGGPGGGTPGSEDTCLVSIAGPASVVEGQTATSYTVSLSQPAATDVTIKLTYSGTATDGSDYTAVTSVTIPAGQSSVDFDLSTIDDALAEGSETITISVGEITGGGFEAIAADPDKGSVTTLVTDDVGGPGGGTPGAEDTCLVSITGPASGSVTEGETAKFTVSLSQPAATDVTIKLTYSGTATDGSDYTAVTSVTIPAGQTSTTFDLSTIDDALAEGSETITISVGEITGGGFEAIAADPDKGSVTTLVTDDVGGPGGGTPGAEDTCLVSITGPASGSVTEGETAKFTVSLSQPAATDVTIKLTYSGTATDGPDYTAVTSVTIPAGQTSTTFDLSTIDDALAEGSETITISVGEITGGGFEAIAADPAKGSVTTLVTDDVGGPGGGTPGSEDTCLVSIAGPASVVEGQTATGYTVSLSQPASTDVTVKLTYSGTATDGSDYTAVTSVTIPAGQSSVEFDLSTIDDALAEGSESITVSVGEITGGGFEAIAADPAKGSVTTLVTDDVGGPGGGTPGAEDTCLVSITGPASGSVTEGETAKFTVSLSQPASTDVTVKLTYSGTATDGSDYIAVTSVTIPAGQTSTTFDLSTIDDALAEGSETITVSVGEITGGGFEAIAADPAKGSVTTLVTDDVGGPGGGTPGAEDTCLVSITGPGSVVEGEVASGYVVTLSQPAVKDVVVTLSYAGTATDGSDFVRVASITVAAGQSQTSFSISTLDDALAEGAEQFTVSLARVEAPGFEAAAIDPARSAVTTTITDDTGPGGSTPGAEDTCLVSLSGPGEVIEGQTASGYTVSLSQPAQTDVTVRLVYTGTATDGVDFIRVTSVTIPAGQSAARFDLQTLDDALAEGSETITVTLGTISGGGFEAIAGDPARASFTTQLRDDAGPHGPGMPGAEDTCLVSIAGPGTVVEGQTASGYTVSLSQPAATDVTVKLTYSGTATDGSDYTAVTSVTIPAGQSSVEFDLSTIDDALAEGSETITVSVGDITGGGFEAIVAHPLERSVTTTLQDDAGPHGPGTPGAEDTCLVSITGPGTVAEGGTAAGYTVTLSQPAVTDVVIRLNYGGSASAGSDYAPVLSVTIPAGSRSASFDLPTLADGRAEGSESIVVTLGSISGGGFEVLRGDPGAFSVTTVIADANNAPVLQADQATTREDTAVSGNLLANDRDPDGDPLAVTHFTWNDQSFTAGSSATIAGVGTLTVGSDGQFLFTPAQDYAGAVPVASCTVSDGRGQVSVSTLTLSITPVNDAPTLRGTTLTLSEEGLAQGRPESGETTATQAGGRLQFSDVDSSALSFTLSAPTALLSSGGVALSWSGDGSAARPLVGSAAGQAVISATIDAEGRYSVTLHAPLDHPVRGQEDALTLSLGVQISDGQSSSSASIDVTVRDDSPVPLCVVRCADLSPVQTNLLITLDVSGSMSTRDGIGGQTRLQSAIASIEKLIDSYADRGDVMVRLVTFSSEASERGASWMTVSQARTTLAGLKAGGNTNYDAALDSARDAFDDPGRLAGGDNIAYFFSDGRPNVPSGDVGIDAAEQKVWERFVEANDIRSYAIGLGKDVPAAALAPIAHDGEGQDTIAPLLVTRFDQLDAALAQTVADPIQGELVAGGIDRAAGADGGHLSALVVDGVQHRWDPSTSASDTVTVRTASGGEFTFNMETGRYSYQPPAGASRDYQEKIGFVLTDADGDSRTGSLTLGVDVDGNGRCDVQCAPAASSLIPDASGCLTGSILNWSLADPCDSSGTGGTSASGTSSGTGSLHCGDLLSSTLDLLAQWSNSSSGNTGSGCTSAPAPACAPAPAPADGSGALSSAEQLLAQTLIRQASDTSSHCGP